MTKKRIKWSYREAIEYIAYNDEPLIMDTEFVKGMLSVMTLAVASGKSEEEIAKDVCRIRLKDKELVKKRIFLEKY